MALAGQVLVESRMSGADARSFMVWRFDPAAWDRIQKAVGKTAEGDPEKVWHWIDRALVFASAEQQRQSLPTLRKTRAAKQRLLATIDNLIDQTWINMPPGAAEPISLNGEVLNWLMLGALRKQHPTGPPLMENSRGTRISIDQSFRVFRGQYSDMQISAQTSVVELLSQLRPLLSLFRELLAESLAETSGVQSSGVAPDLTKSTFVDYTARAYEVAYGRPARPGRRGGPGESGPAVRFIAAVADEVRKATTIDLHRKVQLRRALHVTPNTIRRLLGNRQVRRLATLYLRRTDRSAN